VSRGCDHLNNAKLCVVGDMFDARKLFSNGNAKKLSDMSAPFAFVQIYE
jgi:hypothetical protein